MNYYSPLQIVTVPDPILTRAAEQITDFSSELVELVGRMQATLLERHALGLAAPQVGRSIRLFVMRAYPYAFCNPVIERVLDDDTVTASEGCLSIPDHRANVARVRRIKVAWTSLDGETRGSLRIQDLTARVFLHELDHLDGVLITDRARSV